MIPNEGVQLRIESGGNRLGSVQSIIVVDPPNTTQWQDHLYSGGFIRLIAMTLNPQLEGHFTEPYIYIQAAASESIMSSFNPNTTLGALQIGVLISYVLFGVMTSQTYIYYHRFPDDPPRLKVLVAFVWYTALATKLVCEVIHTVCVGYTLYDYAISDYTHPERLAGAAPKSFDVAILLSAVIGVSVQGFFSFRIYAFSKKLLIPILIWIMALWRLVGCGILMMEGIQMIMMARYEAKWTWLATACWSVSTVNDWTITVTLVFLLHSRRTDGHKRAPPKSRRTAALVDKLITWSIETGMLTRLMLFLKMLKCIEPRQLTFVYHDETQLYVRKNAGNRAYALSDTLQSSGWRYSTSARDVRVFVSKSLRESNHWHVKYFRTRSWLGSPFPMILKPESDPCTEFKLKDNPPRYERGISSTFDTSGAVFCYPHFQGSVHEKAQIAFAPTSVQMTKITQTRREGSTSRVQTPER
ncbi:hypothetical protein B0H16DRAFT_1474540 [Mycena metata]|uniref:DUF6534 domain-containing protein n=1 Tax=Mycena metata TaxID=1033252 RepID=A0AAD7HHU7_9AGAR|nr:hypothetical protein B0H16DRAFT_1474540 [Mycena metata]